MRKYYICQEICLRLSLTAILPFLRADTVFDILKQHFARQGIPEDFISDNGPKFANHEFRAFAKVYESQEMTSSS